MNKAHGIVEVFIEESIITIKYVGELNGEGIELGLIELRKSIEQFTGQPFCILADDLELSGATPEAFEILNEFDNWVNTQCLVAKATVIKSKVLLKIINSNIPARKNQNLRGFENIDEALQWLHNELEYFIESH